MKKGALLVSTIIPVYNCERYLAEAIESALAQTCQPFEIIVVDDGSVDGSPDVAARYPSAVRYSIQQHGGAGSARNRGALLARGDYLAFLDADDIWMPDKVAHQMAAFAADPELELAFGSARQFISPELEESVKKKIRCPEEPMRSFSPSAMMVKRDAFFRVGTFETQSRLGDWVDWYSRATEKGLRSLVVPHVVYMRRLHTSNIGVLERDSRTDYVRALKAALDRRRTMGQAPAAMTPDGDL